MTRPYSGSKGEENMQHPEDPWCNTAAAHPKFFVDVTPIMHNVKDICFNCFFLLLQLTAGKLDIYIFGWIV